MADTDWAPVKRFVVARILPRKFDQEVIAMPFRHYMGEPDSPNFRRAIVEKVGPKVRDVRPGDLVLVGQYAGLEMPEADEIRMLGRKDIEDRRVMREQEIEAVLEEASR